METVGLFVNVSILIVLVALSWCLPRAWGGLGLVGAHLTAVGGWMSMGCVALATGIWPTYDDGLVVLGLVIQALIFNCLMLPVGIWAMLRWRRLSPLSPMHNISNVGKRSTNEAVDAG